MLNPYSTSASGRDAPAHLAATAVGAVDPLPTLKPASVGADIAWARDWMAHAVPLSHDVPCDTPG